MANLSEFICLFCNIYLLIGRYKVLAVALKLLVAALGTQFLDQGSNPGRCIWCAGSWPLGHQASPLPGFMIKWRMQT